MLDRAPLFHVASICIVAAIACSKDDAPKMAGVERPAMREEFDSAVPDGSIPAAAQDAAGKPASEPEVTDASSQVDASGSPEAAAPAAPGPEASEEDAGGPAEPPPETDAGPSPTLDAGPEPEPAEPIDAELAAHIDWVIATVNDGSAPTRAEIRQRFAPSVLAELPPAELATTFGQLSSELRPVTATARTVRGLRAIVRLDTVGGPVEFEIAVTETTPRQITELAFRPAPVAASSYAEIIEALRPLATHTQLLVAHVSPDGRCSPIVQHAAGERLAIGSAFKLWVLLALDQRIDEDAAVSWTTQLPIRDALKSLPSGVLQDEPPGTLLPLAEYATKMIEISDNTATDHLIDFVGRQAVEAAQLATQHSDPDANIPWLSTREMFVLKLALPADELEAYRAASVPEKRMLLEAYRDVEVELRDAQTWTQPRALDIEWFATPQDVCHAFGALGVRAGFTPSSQLLRILGANPGLVFDSEDWSYAGFKGGSEVGVLNMSWLLQRADGGWFSIVLTLNDDAQPVSAAAAVSVASGLIPLVGREPGSS